MQTFRKQFADPLCAVRPVWSKRSTSVKCKQLFPLLNVHSSPQSCRAKTNYRTGYRPAVCISPMKFHNPIYRSIEIRSIHAYVNTDRPCLEMCSSKVGSALASGDRSNHIFLHLLSTPVVPPRVFSHSHLLPRFGIHSSSVFSSQKIHSALTICPI